MSNNSKFTPPSGKYQPHLPVVRVQGVPAHSYEAQRLVARAAGQIGNFQLRMRLQHEAGVVNIRSMAEDYPGFRLTYSNQFGMEYVTVSPRVTPTTSVSTRQYVDKLLIELVWTGYAGDYPPYVQPYATSVEPSGFIWGTRIGYEWTIFGPDYDHPIEIPTVIGIKWTARYQNGRPIGFLNTGSTLVNPPTMRLPSGFRDPDHIGTLERRDPDQPSQLFEMGRLNRDPRVDGDPIPAMLDDAIVASSYGYMGSPLQRSMTGASSTSGTPVLTTRVVQEFVDAELQIPYGISLNTSSDVRLLVLDLKKLRAQGVLGLRLPIAGDLAARDHVWHWGNDNAGGQTAAKAYAQTHPMGTTPMPECTTDIGGVAMPPGQPLHSVALVFPDSDVAYIYPPNPLVVRGDGWEFGGYTSSIEYPYQMLGTYEPMFQEPVYGTNTVKVVTTTAVGVKDTETWLRYLDDRHFDPVRSQSQTSRVVGEIPVPRPGGLVGVDYGDPAVMAQLVIDCQYGGVTIQSP